MATQPSQITPMGGSSVPAAKLPGQANPLGGDNVNDRFTGTPDKVKETDDKYVLDADGFIGVDPIYQNGASRLELPADAPDPDAEEPVEP